MELERRQFDVADPSGQRFGRLADQVARGTAQDEETRRIPGAVNENPQHRE